MRFANNARVAIKTRLNNVSRLVFGIPTAPTQHTGADTWQRFSNWTQGFAHCVGNRAIVAITVLGALLLSTPCFASNNSDYRAYYGVGIGPISGNSVRYSALDLHAGYEYRPWLNFEGHLGLSNSDSYKDSVLGTVETKVSTRFARDLI